MFVARKHPTFPDHFETDRLLIRAPQPNDGRAVNDAVRESIDELRPWMPWAQVVPSVGETETYVREAALRFRNHEDLPLLLFRTSDGLFVGGSGMHRIDWDVPRFEIGYWVRTSLSGQGYITEAVLGITAFAFEQLEAIRLEIRCDARNQRSAAVAERAGFTLEARLRKESRALDGSLRDTLIFARLREGL
jgi:RimJ/RimL family protein N-acetyltransferase